MAALSPERNCGVDMTVLILSRFAVNINTPRYLAGSVLVEESNGGVLTWTLHFADRTDSSDGY